MLAWNFSSHAVGFDKNAFAVIPAFCGDPNSLRQIGGTSPLYPQRAPRIASCSLAAGTPHTVNTTLCVSPCGGMLIVVDVKPRSSARTLTCTKPVNATFL